MLDRLGAAAPHGMTPPDASSSSLAERMRAVMGDERRPDFDSQFGNEILPIEPGLYPEPVDWAGLTREMALMWFQSDFMKAMMLGDPDEKLGVKPEAYAD